MKALPAIRRSTCLLALCYAGLAVFQSGCSNKEGSPQGGGGLPAVIAPVERRALDNNIHTTGTFVAPERTELAVESDGPLSGIHVQEGAQVKKGDLLFELDDARARAEVEVANSQLHLLTQQFSRAEKLLGNNTISQEAFDQAEANLSTAKGALVLAEEDLADRIIKAPFDGVIGERRVSPGQFVRTGDVLAVLYQLDPLELSLHVPERFLSELALNQLIEIRTTAYPDKQFNGTLFYLDPAVDVTTRTLLVKARVDNADGLLRPGMFAEAAIVTERSKPQLMIPDSAIFYRKDQAMVVVRNAQKQAEVRPVSTGARTGDYIQILEGLEEGEQVVAEGHPGKYQPGTPIVVAPESSRYGIKSAVNQAPEEAPADSSAN